MVIDGHCKYVHQLAYVTPLASRPACRAECSAASVNYSAMLRMLPHDPSRHWRLKLSGKAHQQTIKATASINAEREKKVKDLSRTVVVGCNPQNAYNNSIIGNLPIIRSDTNNSDNSLLIPDYRLIRLSVRPYMKYKRKRIRHHHSP